MEPSSLMNKPGPCPTPPMVKIPGAKAATEISTSLLRTESTSQWSMYLPGETLNGINATICAGETANSGSGTSPVSIASNTRVVASDAGNEPEATAFVDARFWPEMARMLPGPSEVFALKVTASMIESVRSAGATMTVAVNVTASVPVAATTCTSDAFEGSVKIALAVPEAPVRTVRALSDPPPAVMVNVTGTAGNGV